MNFRDPRLPDRIWSKVARVPSGCWQWTAGLDRDGYSAISFQGKRQGAHRVFYAELVGPIPSGLQLDHLCRNRACVNPGHLEPVTKRVNTLRGLGPPARNARKTRCPEGHQYTLRLGKRTCKPCEAASQRRYKARKRAEREGTPTLVAAPRDASCFKYPDNRTTRAWHVARTENGAVLTAACSGLQLDKTSVTRSLGDVAEHLRCRRVPCARHWKKEGSSA